MGVLILSIGAVYGTLFHQDLRSYLPFLSIGLVLWSFLSQVINEGAGAYISSSSYIRQTATSKLIYVLQVVWRSVIVLAHNLVIIAILILWNGAADWSLLPLLLPALFILVLNLTWIAMVAALLSARFRDFPQIIAAFLQVAFYATPILFRPESLSNYRFIVTLNPLAHFIDLVRDPLIGQVPEISLWVYNIVVALVGWCLALLLTGKYLKRIAFWV
jgi:lipopolysaccharide transport system permease protein